MNRIIITAIVALMILAASCGQRQPKAADAPQQGEVSVVEKINIISWPRMPVDVFGCMMENTFGHRDERFNCSLTDYINYGGPCYNTDEYYEGPEFPESLVEKVHPWMKSISLHWEGGALQMVIFIFDRELNLTEEQILTEFGLDPDDLPQNITQVDATYGSLMLEGYMHMGAGDMDCDEMGVTHPIDVRLNNDLWNDYSIASHLQAYPKAAKEWEEEMNIHYQSLMELSEEPEREKLKAAQTAWLAFRESEMLFNAAYWNLFTVTDSMHIPSSLAYGVNILRQRTLDLLYKYNTDVNYEYGDGMYDNEYFFTTEEEWDTLLNENHQSLMAKLSREHQDKLQEAQHKWIAFRDIESDDYYRLAEVKKRALRLGRYLNDLNDL